MASQQLVGKSRIICQQCLKSLLTKRLGKHARLSTSAAVCCEDHHFQNSPVPPYRFQKTLPHLPLPTLDQSCDRYLRATEPLVSAEHHVTTRSVVEAFRNGEGRELHKGLIEVRDSHPDNNYVAKYWNDMYLGGRESLVHNTSAGAVLRDLPDPAYMDQVIRTANTIVSTLRFMRTLEDDCLEPPSLPATPAAHNKHYIRYLQKHPRETCTELRTVMPIDMRPFGNIFRSTRIPRERSNDELVVAGSSSHIVVMRNGHFYTVEVLDRDGNMKAGSDIMTCVASIVGDPTSAERPEFPVAALTTDNRDTWAEYRYRLTAAGNAAQLNAIDSSIFLVCLDDEVHEKATDVARMTLHGRGWDRWWDKSFNYLFSKNGVAGLLMEHSWTDGIAMLQFQAAVHSDVILRPAVSPDTKHTSIDLGSSVKKLEFSLTDPLRHRIQAACDTLSRSVAGIDLQYVDHRRFGKTCLKRHKLSPDSIAQLGFQLAFYRLYGHTPPTYESCSTAIFKGGRTETIRPATMETKKVCQMMLESQTKPSASEFKQMICESSALHNKLAMEASLGHGFDRHFFALLSLAQSEGRAIPDVFQDPTFGYSTTFLLSTSTVSIPCLHGVAFAPVCPAGLGIAYFMLEDHMEIYVSSFVRDVDAVAEALKTSYDEIHKVLEAS